MTEDMRSWDGREIDVFAVSGARALKRVGWSDARIADAYGWMPPIHLSTDEIVDHNATIPTPMFDRPIFDDDPFTGDP